MKPVALRKRRYSHLTAACRSLFYRCLSKCIYSFQHSFIFRLRKGSDMGATFWYVFFSHTNHIPLLLSRTFLSGFSVFLNLRTTSTPMLCLFCFLFYFIFLNTLLCATNHVAAWWGTPKSDFLIFLFFLFPTIFFSYLPSL